MIMITAAMNFIGAKESVNQRKLASAIFIDISKAFDCVGRRILLDKLYKSGIRGTFYKLLENYLSNRFQIVNWGRFTSILRDLLNIFINKCFLGNRRRNV
jgi:hypothetical protein